MMMVPAEKLKTMAIAGLLAAALTLTGCKPKGSTGNPPPAAASPEVGVVVMKTEPVALITELPGRVSPHLVAEVRPQVTGIIQGRLFVEGGDVQAGDPLYQIDPATYRAAYASARAALVKSEANVSALKLKATRYANLVTTNAVSRQEYDDTTSELKQTEADIEVGKAAVEAARINLDYTRIVAPISGRIGRSFVTSGALVTANQATALATIQQLDPVFVDVTQSTTELLRLKRGLDSGRINKESGGQAKVKLALEDGSSYPLEGILKFSEVTVDQSTGSVTLRAEFPNPDHLLLPGMFVRAIIQEGVQEQGMLVPQRGVIRDQAGNAVVLVAGDKDVVESRTIQTDRAVGDAWLVSEGLKAGERVIVEGVQRIRPGVTVKVVPFGEVMDASGGQPAGEKSRS